MKRLAPWAFALVAVAANPARAAEPRAEAIVAAFKQVTGGSAWDRLQGCYEQGSHAGGVAYRTWFSMMRYGMRIESRRGDSTRAMGFNGRASWRTNGAGGVDVQQDEAALREGITTAYLSSNGFFFPGRFPASFRYLREATHDGRTFDVLEITPVGGRALDYWFDRASHFLSRIVDSQGTPPVTVEADDYRHAGAIMVAFRLTTLGPDGAVADQGVLSSLTCHARDDASFDPPPPR
jgi:hypothetical protein